MTTLESKASRDIYGVDSFERGLVYAALLLRSSNISPDNTPAGKSNKYFNAVRIIANLTKQTLDGNEASLTIQAKLPYQSQQALVEGGNFIENLGVFNNSEPPVFSMICPARRQSTLFEIPQEPVWINTLERYFVWCAHNLISEYLVKYPNESPPVISEFLEEDSPEPSIVIKTTLAFDALVYLRTNNLFCAVVNSIHNTTAQPNNGSSNGSFLDNSSLINNAFLLKN